MANPVLLARTAAQIRWPGAVVAERGRGHIKHRHPTDPNRFMLDTQVGGVGWHYGPLLDQEVDTAWEPAVAPWQYKMVKAEFNAYLLSRLDAGMVGRYTDPDTGEYVEFDPQNLQWTNDLDQIQPIDVPKAVDAVISDDLATWPNGYGLGRHFSWQAQTARFEKLLTIDSLASLPTANATIRSGGNPALELQLTFRRSAGVEIWINGVLWNQAGNNPQQTSGLVEFRQISTGQVLWWFNLPRSWDSDGQQIIGTFWFKRQGPNLNVFHRIPLSWIEDAARVWPIKVDTTIDVQVGAGANDGYVAGTSFYLTGGYLYAGYFSPTYYHFFARWTGVSIAGTINVSYIQVYYYDTSGSPQLKVWGVDEDNPAAPTTYAEFAADPLTTAGVDWDGAWSGTWNQSPSLNTIFQELVDTYTISSEAVMVQVKNDGATGNYNGCRTYEYNTTLAPKLHIEYTAGTPATLACVVAPATVSAPNASLLGKAQMSAAVAQATGASPNVALMGKALLSTTLAQATTASPNASLLGQALLLASLATMTTASPASVLSGKALLAASVAGATGESPDATMWGKALLSAVVAIISAASPNAAVLGKAQLAASIAGVTAESLNATLTGKALMSAVVAGAIVSAPNATIVGKAGLLAQVASVTVSCLAAAFPEALELLRRFRLVPFIHTSTTQPSISLVRSIQ